ncbi:HotDog domain-containing protein [Dactylonectria estremocensis]|uniref:HotDog domain-containing protein n=1 Tax=Dactylonectria estremocensis TaxID=1079267 RepID=A0A9P9FE79_9HYPO|nr:HotDog domain-containing protein [Dactylonectria estremocensis]
MFTQQIGRSGRQVARRLARAGQARGYAAPASSGGAFRRTASMTLVGLAFSAVGAAGMWHTMQQSGMGFYSDEESLNRFVAGDDEARLVEETINNHPLVAELRANTTLTESRPHMKMPVSYRSKTLTGGALAGQSKIVVPPYVWLEDGGKSIVCISYVGEDLCGHPGIVHGGFLATMLDEGLARCCFGALPHNIAVTANLSVDYRKPTPAGSFLVLRATTTKVDGRKAWVKGHIELLADPGETPAILTEATGLFISPKYASMMPKIT